MYRLAIAALLLATTSASAGDQSKYAHTHVGKHTVPGASFTAPINFRANNGSGFARTSPYSDANTVDYRVCQGWVFAKCRSPLLETARGSADPTRSVVSVEEY